jgi:hypothetical protein
MFEPPSTIARLRGQGTPRSRRAAAPAVPGRARRDATLRHRCNLTNAGLLIISGALTVSFRRASSEPFRRTPC